MVETTKSESRATIVGIITPENRHDPVAWKALDGCDRVEFRADFWEPSQIIKEAKSFQEECRRKFGKKLEIIFTLRLVSDGGNWSNRKAADREKIWLALGMNEPDPLCDWIDIEIENFSSLSAELNQVLQSRRIKILASHHNMDFMPPLTELEKWVNLYSHISADSLKIAVQCRQEREVLELLEFARTKISAIPESCVLSMGALGQATRLLMPLLGCPMTYGYLTGKAVAPGQLSVPELKNFFSRRIPQEVQELSYSELLAWTETQLEEGLLEK